MAATETKVEIKEPPSPPPPPPPEEGLEPLMCKTCVLKVSIHCQGCTRKVKKILQSMDGVYCTTIDLKQQKVVVKGTVDSETLIKKLSETGKRAELWPDQPELKKKKKKKKKKKNKGPKPEKSDQECSEDSNQSGDETEKEAVKVVVQDKPKLTEGNKNNEGCVTGLTGLQFQDPRMDMRQTMMLPPCHPSSMGGKRVTIAVPGMDENLDCGRRMKSKGQKGNVVINGGNDGVTAVEHAADWNQMPVYGPHGPCPGSVSILGPPNESPPRHHYHAPPSPAYHTTCPTRYCASYYTSPQPYSYPHVYRGVGFESDSETYTSPSPPSCSFELFSDENPNACFVM